MAAYRFLIRRMLSLPLNSEQQYEEWQHTVHIAHNNNNIPPTLLIQLRLRIQWSISQPKSPTPVASNNGTKWTTFMYSSPQVRKLTNKHTNIRIAFKCSNTISQLFKPANKTLPPTPYDMQDMQQGVCRPNQLQPQATLQGARSLHQKQQPAVCICSPRPQQPTWIRSHRKNKDPSQAPQEHLINPLQALLHTITPQNRKAHFWTKPWRT